MNETEKIVKTVMEINLTKLSKEQLEEVLGALKLKHSEANWRLNSIKFCETHFGSGKK